MSVKITENEGSTIITEGDINIVVDETKENVETNIQKYIKIIENIKGEI